MTVKQLRERVVAEAEAAREIKDKAEAEGRGLTAEEAATFDKHMDTCDRLEREADRQERLETKEAKLAEPQERKSQPELSDGAHIEVTSPGPRLHRYGQLVAFKGPEAMVKAYRSGRFLAATIFGHAQSRQWCREHGVELRADGEFDARAMSEGINTAGGFLVPDEFETAIIDLRELYGMARQECQIKPMASDHSNQPKKTGGLTAYPRGENQQATESQGTWGNVELTARSWDVLTRISNELSEDTLISVADDVANDGALAFATAEDNACIDGDGTSDYHGIIGIRTKMIDGSHSGSYVENPANGDEWSEITDAMLLAVMAAVPKYARRGAKWHCSPYAKVAVFDRLMRKAGGNTVQNLAAGAPATYGGYPIAEWPSMPETDAAAALNAKIMLMFGNMRMSSKLGTRRGLTIAKLSELYAVYGQVGIMMSERFDLVHHSITGATTSAHGPIVGMLGNT